MTMASYYTAKELVSVQVINPAFRVDRKDIESAKKKIRKDGYYARFLVNNNVYYQALSVRIALRELGY